MVDNPGEFKNPLAANPFQFRRDEQREALSRIFTEYFCEQLKILTEEEKAELRQCPIGKAMDLPPEQRKLRQRIGKKINEYSMQRDTSMPSDYAPIYQKYPPWKFYIPSSADDPCLPRRMYGIYRDAKKQPLLHMASAHVFRVSLVANGVPPEEVTPVDEWPADHLARIKMCGNPALFEDPLGFLLAQA